MRGAHTPNPRNLQGKFASRNAEYEHLEATHGHTQRRLTEVSSQLQRKDAELATKEQSLQQHINEVGGCCARGTSARVKWRTSASLWIGGLSTPHPCHVCRVGNAGLCRLE